MKEYNESYLHIIEETIGKGHYKATWESLSGYRVPDWYRNSKFGIFIHWGIYSVPAFQNEWYPRNMHLKGSKAYEYHKATYGEPDEFKYTDFIPMFTAKNFDAHTWAKAIKASGARYVVPVAEHHDGFQMYSSRLSKWNSAEMGPKRDVLGELYSAFNENDLIPCASSHRAEHWWYMEGARDFDIDVDDENSLYYPSMKVEGFTTLNTEPEPTKEYLEDWLVRTCELVDSYHPKLLYFDWWIEEPFFKPYLKAFLAYYYNRAEEWNEEVVVTYKYDACAFGTAVVDIERGQFGDIEHFPWQTCTSMGRNSWGYTKDNEFKDSEELLQDLVDIVSKNGNMLLNIGPKPDGTFTEEETRNLEEMGAWLERNGECIYETRPWWKYGEGETKIASGCFQDSKKKIYTEKDIRYTVKGRYLYAIALKRSGSGEYNLTYLKTPPVEHCNVFRGIIGSVTRLEDNSTPEYLQDETGLHIKTAPSSENTPIAFRIELI